MTRVPADEQRLREASETLDWIKDWREGMFTPAYTPDGWSVEMYGLVDSAEMHAKDVLGLAALLRVREQEAAEARVLYVDRLIERDAAVREAAELREALLAYRAARTPEHTAIADRLARAALEATS